MNQATAVASTAGVIEKAKQEQQVSVSPFLAPFWAPAHVMAEVHSRSISSCQVVRETTVQSLEKARVLVEVAEREAERIQKVKEGESLAVLIEQRNKVLPLPQPARCSSLFFLVLGGGDSSFG